jgi:2-octaprenyl-6-methoxyphenol hydroxylase
MPAKRRKSNEAPAPIDDVTVVGGGVAGLTLALALKTALSGRLMVTLVDPALAGPVRQDDRAFALAAGARKMFETLGIWGEVEPETQPIREMVITDSRVEDKVRPVFLSFDGEVQPGQPFAHMAPQSRLLASLRRAATTAGVRLIGDHVAATQLAGERIEVTLGSGACLASRLVAACDGARSPLRERAGIGLVAWDYPQSGIVATIAHERDHEGRAEEHFLPSGPFAILPLRGRRSSIVWTERRQAVPHLLALDQDDMTAEIERRFGLKLGKITLASRVAAYPLSFAVARRFVASRLALVGDAAHVIHPIAGQGLNLGLKDVAALAEVAVEAASLGLDPGSDDVLARYERARRFDTVMMGAVTDGLNRLFSTDLTPLRMIRDFGLGVVDRLPALKRSLMREAAGVTGSLPRLMRGERL